MRRTGGAKRLRVMDSSIDGYLACGLYGALSLLGNLVHVLSGFSREEQKGKMMGGANVCVGRIQ